MDFRNLQLDDCAWGSVVDPNFAERFHVDAKSVEELKEELIKRIKEAARYIPLENICISPQCGFSSTEEGNAVTEEDQWKKIALLKEVVEEVFI